MTCLLILTKHLGEELSLVIFSLRSKIFDGMFNAVKRCVILVLVHLTENVRKSLVHDLIILFLDHILPTEHAVVPFHRSFSNFNISKLISIQPSA